MASSTVFISYRREDSAGHAGRLFDRFVGKLGRDQVFRDIDNIRPGENFTQAIRQKIDGSAVLLVLIGPRWLTAADQDGRQRLAEPDDLVRLEIESGLERKLLVIPVLLPGANMPAAQDLPESLRPLTQHNAFEIREAHFDQDVLQLIAETMPPGRPNLFRYLKQHPICLVLLGVAVAAVFFVSTVWLHWAFLMTSVGPEQKQDPPLIAAESDLVLKILVPEQYGYLLSPQPKLAEDILYCEAVGFKVLLSHNHRGELPIPIASLGIESEQLPLSRLPSAPDCRIDPSHTKPYGVGEMHLYRFSLDRGQLQVRRFEGGKVFTVDPADVFKAKFPGTITRVTLEPLRRGNLDATDFEIAATVEALTPGLYQIRLKANYTIGDKEKQAVSKWLFIYKRD